MASLEEAYTEPVYTAGRLIASHGLIDAAILADELAARLQLAGMLALAREWASVATTIRNWRA
jgi:hypothetical protein